MKRAKQKAKADRVPMMAGSLAYHSFLAIVPALIALIGFTQLIGVSTSLVNKLVHGVGTALPPGASTVLSESLQAAHRRTGGALVATVVAVVVAIWSASSAMSALQTGMGVAYEVPNDRPFVLKRLMALVLLVIFGVFGGLAAALIVFASPLGGFLQHHVGVPSGVFTPVWTVVRWIVTVLVLVLLMALLFYLAPNRTAPGWQWLSVGGLFATVAFLGASLALSFYVSSFGSYGKTYGALAGVAVLLLWLYVTSYVILFGAQLNAETERRVVLEGGATGSQPPSSRHASSSLSPS